MHELACGGAASLSCSCNWLPPELLNLFLYVCVCGFCFCCTGRLSSASVPAA